ncbi:MAG: hypothetical protein ABR572_12920 [Cryomorphaceae bacterium]
MKFTNLKKPCLESLSLSLSLSLSAFVIFSTAHSQNPGVLFANKTSCEISVAAGCGDCSLQDIEISEFQIIQPNDFLLFDEALSPAFGCEGDFALFRFAFPPFDVYQTITFVSTGPNDPCAPNPPCDPAFAQASFDFFQIDNPCLEGTARVTGVYHDQINPPSGSNCHMVAVME